MEIHAIPAVWLLYPPHLTSAYGRRYAELYLEAWENARIPETALASPAPGSTGPPTASAEQVGASSEKRESPDAAELTVH